MSTIQAPQSVNEIPISILKNIISLSTSGFGVVVALAWNEVIKNAVETYIDPWLGKSSGVVSLFIYAVGITLLAVFITMQLALLEKRLETLGTKPQPTKPQPTKPVADKK